MIQETAEWCPFCEQEHDYQFNDEQKLPIAVKCKGCGRKLFLCSLCDIDERKKCSTCIAQSIEEAETLSCKEK